MYWYVNRCSDATSVFECENCGSDCFVDVLGFWSVRLPRSASTEYSGTNLVFYETR